MNKPQEAGGHISAGNGAAARHPEGQPKKFLGKLLKTGIPQNDQSLGEGDSLP
jgi:hypothetical protein